MYSRVYTIHYIFFKLEIEIINFKSEINHFKFRTMPVQIKLNKDNLEENIVESWIWFHNACISKPMFKVSTF